MSTYISYILTYALEIDDDIDLYNISYQYDTNNIGMVLVIIVNEEYLFIKLFCL